MKKLSRDQKRKLKLSRRNKGRLKTKAPKESSRISPGAVVARPASSTNSGSNNSVFNLEAFNGKEQETTS